jgi:hypothetical protein
MDTFLLRMFQRQVLIQCRFMLRAAEDTDIALKQQKVDVTSVFYSIQNMLNAAANISKALWGQGGKLADQRKPLRDSIGIADDSPLREVTMRNNFEHFDERLDRWWVDSKNHNHTDFNLGKQKDFPDEIDNFRIFDPDTTDLSFWGQRFNLKNLITEVQAVLPKLEGEAKKPHYDRGQQAHSTLPEEVRRLIESAQDPKK